MLPFETIHLMTWVDIGWTQIIYFSPITIALKISAYQFSFYLFSFMHMLTIYFARFL